jgi:hypothetical protein
VTRPSGHCFRSAAHFCCGSAFAILAPVVLDPKALCALATAAIIIVHQDGPKGGVIRWWLGAARRARGGAGEGRPDPQRRPPAHARHVSLGVVVGQVPHELAIGLCSESAKGAALARVAPDP